MNHGPALPASMATFPHRRRATWHGPATENPGLRVTMATDNHSANYGADNAHAIPLGSLERDVLAFMRTSGEATVPVASRAIAASRPRSLASVSLVLKRLARKGLLTRIKDGDGLRYRMTG